MPWKAKLFLSSLISSYSDCLSFRYTNTLFGGKSKKKFPNKEENHKKNKKRTKKSDSCRQKPLYTY
jgi:hypothetical protein